MRSGSLQTLRRVRQHTLRGVRAADLRPDLADLLATAAEPSPSAEACA